MYEIRNITVASFSCCEKGDARLREKQYKEINKNTALGSFSIQFNSPTTRRVLPARVYNNDGDRERLTY